MSDQHLIQDLESLASAPDETADYAALARAGITRGKERIRRRRVMGAVAVIAGVTAVVLGVTQLGPLLQPRVATTVATTTGADPGASTPVSSPTNTSQPSRAPSASASNPKATASSATGVPGPAKSTQPTAAAPTTKATNQPDGTLALGTVATFTYFSAQAISVKVTNENADANFYAVRVKVCALKMPPGSSTTTITQAPWNLTVTGGTAQKNGFEGGSGPDDLVDTTVRAGQCVTGVVTLMTVPKTARATQVVYRNSLGETATWAIGNTTAPTTSKPGSLLKVGQKATMTHFSAAVTKVQRQQYTDGFLYGVSVTVCVTKVPSGSSTTISPNPWQLTLSAGTAQKDGFEGEPFGYGTALPTKTVAQGDCVSGIVTFLVKPGGAQVRQIVYRNSLGETATWRV